MDFEPSIEGTATYDMIDIEWHDNEDRFRVLGYYGGDPATEYGVPEGKLKINGMEVVAGAETRFTLKPENEQWIKATSDGDKLHIAIEK